MRYYPNSTAAAYESVRTQIENESTLITDCTNKLDFFFFFLLATEVPEATISTRELFHYESSFYYQLIGNIFSTESAFLPFGELSALICESVCGKNIDREKITSIIIFH